MARSEGCLLKERAGRLPAPLRCGAVRL